MKLIYLYPDLFKRPRMVEHGKKQQKCCCGVRRGKVNKRPLKFIITGLVILKLLVSLPDRYVKKSKFDRNG